MTLRVMVLRGGEPEFHNGHASECGGSSGETTIGTGVTVKVLQSVVSRTRTCAKAENTNNDADDDANERLLSGLMHEYCSLFFGTRWKMHNCSFRSTTVHQLLSQPGTQSPTLSVMLPLLVAKLGHTRSSSSSVL